MTKRFTCGMLGRLRAVAWVGLIASLAAGGGGVFEFAYTPTGTHIQQRVVAQLELEGGRLIPSTAIPRVLEQAVVAAEDERFFEHGGVDPVSIARAGLFDTAHWCLCQGGSTITQQLVKLIYYDGTDTGPSKIADAVVAVKVETVIGKQQILADYLSVIPTGPGLYGVAEAACLYFGRSLELVTLAQAAMLAGLAQAPVIDDPLLHPRHADRRLDEVLASMVADGYITQEQATGALSTLLTNPPVADC